MRRWFSIMMTVASSIVVGAAAADCADDREPRRLAILVSDEADSLATLQALLEVEAQIAWSGELVERKQLDQVLREQQFAAALSPSNRLQLGRLLRADYLLNVRHSLDREIRQVHCLVNRFPDATVIAEFQLPLASADSLAKRIAVRAIRGINAHQRDTSEGRLYVSLGSFLCDDPFDRYATFGDELHQRLRKQIASHPRLTAAERFFPSHLLREFQLGRAGQMRAVTASLAVPTSDILIVGQFDPSRVQPLEGKAVELSFSVQLLSPAGVFPARQVEFKTNGPDAEAAAEEIESALRQLIDSLADEPPQREKRINSDKEFLTLKQQAFRLMPDPPQKDGNYHTKGGYYGSSQSGGPPHALGRALRAVENAMLFRSDDTQLLVCAGVLLQEQANVLRWTEVRGSGTAQPSPRERALRKAGFDCLETALLLESNWNTRGVYFQAISRRTHPLMPERVVSLSERVVREGTEAGWFPHQVKYAWIWLARLAPDLSTKIRHVQKAANQNVEPDTLFNLVVTIENTLQENGEDKQIAGQVFKLADEFVQRDSAFHQAIGHFLRSIVYFHADNSDPRWLPDFRKTIDLFPASYAERGKPFIKCGLSYRLYHMLRTLPTGPNGDELNRETLELFETYAARQMEVGDFGSSNVPQCMLALMLPAMYEQGRYEAALGLLSPLIEHYDWGGSADYERMKLVRWQDHLRQTIASDPRLDRDELTRISLPTHDGEARIKKLVHAADKIWVLRSDIWLQDRVGELFELPTDTTKAKRVDAVEGVVTDMAASSDQLAVATIDRGLFLLDYTSDKVVHLDPSNSPLPSQKLRTVTSDGNRFYLGLPGNDFYHVYELDPTTNTLRDLESKLSYHAYYQTKYSRTEKQIVVQTWDERTFDDGREMLRLKRKQIKEAIHVTTVTNDGGQALFEYTGVELNYIYDFARWDGKLVFATGNGLYMVWPEDRRLRCVMNDLDTEFFSLCGVGNRLYVGTNQGLYRIDRQMLDRLPSQSPPASGALEKLP